MIIACCNTGVNHCIKYPMPTGAKLTVIFLKTVAINSTAMLFRHMATIFSGCDIQSMV